MCLSVSKAIYGYPVTLPGELVDVPEMPLDTFLGKLERAIDGFTIPLPHHVSPVSPSQLPEALIAA